MREREGQQVKREEKGGKDPIAHCPIKLDTQGPNLYALDTIKAQFKPNCQAQSVLGPEIFKAHFEYAPATSKLRSIINWSIKFD